jgi:hypothetical protein
MPPMRVEGQITQDRATESSTFAESDQMSRECENIVFVQ